MDSNELRQLCKTLGLQAIRRTNLHCLELMAWDNTVVTFTAIVGEDSDETWPELTFSIGPEVTGWVYAKEE